MGIAVNKFLQIVKAREKTGAHKKNPSFSWWLDIITTA
jgi:hypothetical protein